MSVKAQRKHSHGQIVGLSGVNTVNNIEISQWWKNEDDLYSEILKVLLSQLNKPLNICVSGGGLMSQKQVVLSIVYKYLFKKGNVKNIENLKNTLRSKYFYLNLLKSDLRRPYAKKIGGPKSRKRYQKSYR